MSKNILNKRRRKEKNELTNSIKIINSEENITLQVNKKWALSQGAYNLSKDLLLSISPLFLNQNKQVKENYISSSKDYKNIAIFIENMPHYTGGRYSIFQQAMLLSHFAKVTVYMNERPPFLKDFEKYKTKNFQLSIDKNFGLNAESNEHDLVIGTPVAAGEFAVEYAKKFNIKSYLILFESPNWVSTMREGIDADEHFWSGYKRALMKCDKVIVPSYESKKWATEWLGHNNIDVVYPCMNEAVAKEVKDNYDDKWNDNKKHILFVARMTKFKNPLNIVKKFNKDEYVFHFIGKIWEDGKNYINKLKEDGYNLTIHGGVNDYEKFKIIKKCDLMMFPSYFEGFGMPPMEALYFNKPVITYDLPVLKEIYSKYDGVYFVPVGDEKIFAETVGTLIGKKIKTKVPKFYNPRECVSKLLDILDIPKISTGTIVYNGEDYLRYALESIKDVVWEMIVVDGRVMRYGEAQEVNSTDKTKEIIKEMKNNDVLGKIKYFNTDKLVKSKVELQNIIIDNISGKYYIKLDHDEIWKPQTMLQAINILEEKPSITVLRMPFLHFWLSFNKAAKDNNGKWSTKHPRVWRWRKDFKHNKSFNYFEDKNGVKVGAPFYKEETFEGEFIYHFGWVRTYDKLMEKIDYYKNRGIEKYVEDTVTNWKDDKDRTQPTQNENSWAEEFKGELPEILNMHPYLTIKDIREVNMSKIILNKKEKRVFEEPKEVKAPKEVSKKIVTTGKIGSFVGGTDSVDNTPESKTQKSVDDIFDIRVSNVLKDNDIIFITEVPKTLEELVKIKGIGKATAKKILNKIG